MAQKASKLELRSRLRVVQQWILDGHPFADIIRSSITQWGISRRHSERYYSLAYRLFAEGEQKNIDIKKAYYLQAKRQLIKNMDPEEKKTAGGAMVLSKIYDSMAEIEGVKSHKMEIDLPLDRVLKVEVVHTNAPRPANSEKDIDV